MIDKHLILHLTLIENIGPAIIQRIIQLQRSGALASDLYLFSASDWMQACGFTYATAEKITDGLRNKKLLDQELALIEDNNIQWATVEDETYPQLLREIYLPPAVLYWKGSLSPARPECPSGVYRRMAVVGARKADAYGQQVIDSLIPELVAAEYTIVSGGALGIDAMAHATTLKSGGKTIAVLGSGLLQPYPHSNRNLFKAIVDYGGSMVSSFPLRMQALPGNFPARNRIITGLSRGCLVVQAAKKSGALISADYAMEQGREVFAVPGPFDSELSAGCNALIQKGAKLVTNAGDILEEFGDRIIISDLRTSARPEPVEGSGTKQLSLDSVVVIPAKKIKKPVVDPYAHYSDTQKKIIAACKQPSYFDSIIVATQLSSEAIQSELFNLQLDGIVSQDFTGMWTTL